MKTTMNKILAKLTGLQLAKATNPKEKPLPLISSSALRIVFFYDLLKKIVNIEGDVVECGVGWGRSLFAFCTLTQLFENKRHIHGFDSFQGFPEPTADDKPGRYNIKKGHYSTNKDGVIRYLLNSGIEYDFIIPS